MCFEVKSCITCCQRISYESELLKCNRVQSVVYEANLNQQTNSCHEGGTVISRQPEMPLPVPFALIRPLSLPRYVVANIEKADIAHALDAPEPDQFIVVVVDGPTVPQFDPPPPLRLEPSVHSPVLVPLQPALWAV